jgi:hypothetical protein
MADETSRALIALQPHGEIMGAVDNLGEGFVSILIKGGLAFGAVKAMLTSFGVSNDYATYAAVAVAALEITYVE